MKKLLFLLPFIASLSACVKVDTFVCSGKLPTPQIYLDNESIPLGNSFTAQVYHASAFYTYKWIDPMGNCVIGNDTSIKIVSDQQAGVWKVVAAYNDDQCISDTNTFMVSTSYVSPGCSQSSSVFTLDYSYDYAISLVSAGVKPGYYAITMAHLYGQLTLYFKYAPQPNRVYVAHSWPYNPALLNSSEYLMEFTMNSLSYYPKPDENLYVELHNGMLYAKFCYMALISNGQDHTGSGYLHLN